MAVLPRFRALAATMGLALLTMGCAHHIAPGPQCPAGQEASRTAQLYFGREVKDSAPVSEADFARFVDEELTPRFPDGLTVSDAGGQWREPSGRLVREPSKVVFVILPKAGDAQAKLDAARAAYKARFRQDSVLLVTQASCVSF